MEKLLNNKVAVITGAAKERGIGIAIAKLYYEQGAKVAILDTDYDLATKAAGSISSSAIGIECDVRNFDQCMEACETTVNKFGRIDILVNNAGITEPLDTLNIERKNYDMVMDVNLRGGLHMCQAVIPTMQKQNSGSIVFISSLTGQKGGGIFGGPHYAASKSAVLGLSKSMAREFGPQGIRVNAVAPGLIDSDISKGRRSPEEREQDVKGSPIPRLGKPEEVAGVCLFLNSELSSYVTGAVIDVNGGLHMH